MKKYYSLSKYPGNKGKHFYNSFFRLHKINAEYIPLGVSESDFEKTLITLKNENAVGISISMPYKNIILKYLDATDITVNEYNCCNTVLRLDGKLIGYNTDIAGVKAATTKITNNDRISILGDGSMGKMFERYLKDIHPNIRVYSRSLGNWEERHSPTDVLINCTSFGTINKSSPVNFLNSQVRLVIDLATQLGDLGQQSFQSSAEYISGSYFYKHQFMEQYAIYTGRTVDEYEYESIAQYDK